MDNPSRPSLYAVHDLAGFRFVSAPDPSELTSDDPSAPCAARAAFILGVLGDEVPPGAWDAPI